ncbi:MAG: hypothetical protein JWO25_989 [Alphaproteobacteria bacterium]|nr:hypothetical protein [Alphaproteobacteria bacterium]
MRHLWTLKRASGVGVVAGLVALALWPFLGVFGPILLRLFFLAAALSGLCGFSVLAMTIHDIATNPRRGTRVRPLRSFDIAIGVSLLVLSWFELRDVLGLFPA